MELKDRDLLSVQELRQLMQKAKVAQRSLAEKSQQEVDILVQKMAQTAEKNAEYLAKLANEETGFGNVPDKIRKNQFAAHTVHEHIKNMKTVGEISYDAEKGLRVYAVPKGVIAGIIPSTNPTSTAIFKALISVKSGNAVVLSPHPSAKNCICETVRLLRQSLSDNGADENLVSCISMPSLEATNELMRHRDTAMILATGGGAMVRAAYSSGNPAIGVGAGNGPAFIERTADVKRAARDIIESKTFDNGTICASEQSVICETCMEKAVQTALESEGGYFLDESQKEKLGKFILRPNGTMNPQIVGKTAQEIARLSGIIVPDSAKVLIARESGVGRDKPYSSEKLAPILAFYVEENHEAVCELCVQILQHEGAGHTFSMHSKDEGKIEYFARRVPVSRFLVNTASALGGIGATTNLSPSLTLGCGAIGGSSISENISPLDLLDYKTVAYGRNSSELDDIVAKVIEKLGQRL